MWKCRVKRHARWLCCSLWWINYHFNTFGSCGLRNRQAKGCEWPNCFVGRVFLICAFSPSLQCPAGYRVRFWIHAKHPEALIASATTDDDAAWLRERVLPFSHKPEWGSVELVRAALDLLQTSYDADDSIQWFVLASESCLPVRPVNEVRLWFGVVVVWSCVLRVQCFEELTRDNRSWVYYDIPRSRYDYDRQRNIVKGLFVLRHALFSPFSCGVVCHTDPLTSSQLCKSDQWFCLTRSDVTDVLTYPAKHNCRENGMFVFMSY